MSETEEVRHIVINQTNQPVELHLPSGLIVLAPRGRAEVSESDLSAPQLQELRRSRLVEHERAAAKPGGEEAAPGDPADDSQAAAGEDSRDSTPERKTRSARKS